MIVVDWWPMQSIWSTIPLDYWTASGYVGEVGSYVAAMINFLENHGMNLETTTLIGHSLGAHVMGIAGYRAKSKVNYIVGTLYAEQFVHVFYFYLDAKLYATINFSTNYITRIFARVWTSLSTDVYYCDPYYRYAGNE